ncbi:hypothetical protein RJT34_13707 [Clitoria ternatea]|uniref:Dof zinc finger protein n=1 Tax=Clitoria ternatea TaxID=43366 RepID=A0AAN9PLQ0_CLITE
MEQGGGSRGGDKNKQPPQQQQQLQGDAAQVMVPQQPQKCPRCDSLNTKFCYYNNYSLSQPRYFCKTCRRYWTQGGTLRNVPVGGGCRKGKRAKISPSSSDSSSKNNSSRSLPPPPQGVPIQNQPPLTTLVRATKDPSSALASPSTSPFYQGVGVGSVGGGYLSSLAAIHSLNPSSHPFDHVGVHAMRSSNLGLLAGFNVASQRLIRPTQFYQMGGGCNERDQAGSLYATEQGLVNPTSSSSSMVDSSFVSQHDWPQGFINHAANRASDASLWSTISTTSIGGNSERTSASASAGYSSDVVPNQWPDLSGFGPPQ